MSYAPLSSGSLVLSCSHISSIKSREPTSPSQLFLYNTMCYLRSTQPGHPSVGRHNEYWWWSRSPLGKKWRVLHNSGHVPGLLAYWPSRLKALVAMGPAFWLTCVVCYSLIGFTLAGLKAYEWGWAPAQRTWSKHTFFLFFCVINL